MHSYFWFPKKSRPHGGTNRSKTMKLLFYSAERDEVELLRHYLIEAAIDCEIHDSGQINGLSLRPPEAELWIHHDTDSYRAVMLCVEHNIGFAKRPPQPEDLAA